MKAAFKPPPKKKAEVPPPEFIPSLTSAPSINEPENANPLLITPQEGPNANNPINPTLLSPLDSNSVAAVQSQMQPEAKEGEDTAALGPPTPATQVKQKSTKTPPTPVSDDVGRGRGGGGATPSEAAYNPRGDAPTPRAGSQQRKLSFDRSLARDSARRSGKATPKLGQDNLNSLDDMEKIEGQDSLEVRTVALANGQVASLILEEGRLQRIVSSNGQIAELNWQPPPTRAAAQGSGRRNRQLSVKMHRGVSPPRKAQSHMTMAMPGSLKRWANSLNSQRLTTGPLTSDLSASPGRSGGKTQSSREMRQIKSIDMSRPAKDGRRRGFVQSLFSMPTHAQAEQDATQNMQTILETNSREAKGEWNPMGSTWLPSDMTFNESGDAVTESTAQQDRRRRTHSVDTSLAATRFRLQTGSQQLPPISSPPDTPMNAGTPTKRLKVEKAKKTGMWSSLKKALHIPKISGSGTPRSQGTTPRTPGSHTPGSHTPGSHTPGTPRSAKQSKPTSKRMKGLRFSIGGARKSNKDGADLLPDDLDATPGKSQSAGVIPTPPQPSAEPAASSRSRSTSDFGKGIGMDIARMADSLEESDAAERDAQSGRGAPDAKMSSTHLGSDFQDVRTSRIEEDVEYEAGPSSMEGPHPPSDVPRYSEWLGGSGAQPAPAQLKDTFTQPHSKSYGLNTGGSLVDTSELKAALANRKSSGLQSLTSDFSAADTPKSGAGRKHAADVQQLAGGKQRTLMAGKWQKNFTEGTSGSKVDDLLHVSSLQRLARERIMEMQIVETEDTFELVWHIPLNGSASKISKTDRYLKNGEVVEAARRDGRPGLLRSQLTFTPEGHVHIRALQGEPFSAVFHDRIKLSSGGRRIKFEQKFQLLQPGVAPVKYFSIWHRVE